MLPDNNDIRAHRRALSKLQISAKALTSSIRTPESLGDELLKVARTAYRQGHKVAKYQIELPCESFKEWALAQGHITDQPSFLDNEIIRRSVLRAADEYIRKSLSPGVFLSFVAVQVSSDTIKFGVEISFINPSDG